MASIDSRALNCASQRLQLRCRLSLFYIAFVVCCCSLGPCVRAQQQWMMMVQRVCLMWRQCAHCQSDSCCALLHASFRVMCLAFAAFPRFMFLSSLPGRREYTSCPFPLFLHPPLPLFMLPSAHLRACPLACTAGAPTPPQHTS